MNSPVVQWLRLHVINEGGMSLIPGQGNKIPHAARHGQKKKKKITKKLKIENLKSSKGRTSYIQEKLHKSIR